MDAISVLLDVGQTRIVTDRLATLVTYDDWSKRFFDNVYREPVTQSITLLPNVRDPYWYTTFTGDYARFAPSDFILTSGKWVNDPILGNGDHWLKLIDSNGTPEAVTTASTMTRNGGMFLSWYAANASAENWVQMECGWGSASDPFSNDVSLRFYSGGEVEVWRNGYHEGTYSISGNKASQQTADSFVDVMILPWGKRELLVTSNRGNGFVHLFEDIDVNDPDPTIVGAKPFWFYAPQGLNKVQCAPVRFPSSGYICGVKTIFNTLPSSSQTLGSLVYADTRGGSATASLVSFADPDVAYDRSSKECRVRIDLLSSGTYRTPILYGAHVYYDVLTGATPSNDTDVTPWITKLSLEIPDSPSDARLNVLFKNPAEIETAGVSKFLRVSNRPIRVKLGNQRIYVGSTEPIHYTEALDDMARRVELDARDSWKRLEGYRFSDPVPLDGLNLKDAFTFVLKTAGIAASNIDIEDVSFSIPKAESPGARDFSWLIEVGDTAADVIQRLYDAFLGNWFMGFVPTGMDAVVFRMRSPESLYAMTPSYQLYPSVESYLAILGDDATTRSAVPQYVFRSYREEKLEPEANDIWIMGIDLKTKRPIQCHKPDVDSQNPTLAVNARPDNWLGEIRKYGLIEPKLTTQAAIERAADIMYARLTPIRVIAEWDCDLMIKADGTPVWRGDVVSLYGYGDYRIRSFSVDFVSEPNSGWTYWRPTHYVAEKIVDPSVGMSQLAGRTLAEITQAQQLRSLDNIVIRKGGENLLNLMPGMVVAR